ncbi:MAG: gamma-glutamylcyclotransferase family protein [Woeseia sp.]
MSTYRYAAYGSNLHPRRLQKRVSSARLLGTGLCSEFDLRFHKQSDVDGSGKCSIFPGTGGVHVAIYEIETSHKIVLDRIEGLGQGYELLTLRDDVFGDCLTYVANPAVVNAAMRPFDWYKELVLLGCKLHGFPDGYIQEIMGVDALVDPDADRSRQQWALVEQLRAYP